MLVLSRRPNETVLFPNLGVSVRILRVKGQVVSVGLEAPDDVQIVRGEVAPEGETRLMRNPQRLSLHALRNRLNSVALSVQLLQEQIAQGRMADCEARLNKALDDLEALDEMLSGMESAPQQTRSGSAFQVLLIEDDSNERVLLDHLLSLCGCQVVSVGDGQAALEYLAENPLPDFALLDMSMPRCGGREFIKAVRQQEKYDGLRIFAVSGQTSQTAGVPVGPDGVENWFQKPLNARRMLAAMCQAPAGA